MDLQVRGTKMKRSLISRARSGIVPGAMLFAFLQLNACNSKSPSIEITGKDGANAEPEEIYNEVSGGGTKTDTAKPSVPKGDPTEASDGDESASVPTIVTGSPIQENRKSNGDQVLANGRYFIKGAYSKKCIALQNDSRESGAQFVQRTCDRNNGSMKFDVYVTSNGYFLIYNFGTSKFMEIRDQMPVMQAALQQNDRAFKPYQDFIIQERSDGFLNIKTSSGGMFVDLAGASTADGALIQLWNVGTGMSAAWQFEPAP